MEAVGVCPPLSTERPWRQLQNRSVNTDEQTLACALPGAQVELAHPSRGLQQKGPAPRRA